MRRPRKDKLGGAGNTDKWKDRLIDVPAFILGNAPSLNKVDLGLLKNYFTIGINRIFKKYDPTIIVWQDLALWIQHQKQVKKMKAIKYCRKGADSGKCYHFNMHGRKSQLTDTPAILYGRGSSGPIAFQLAYSLGCNPVVLVGMDCRYNKKTGDTDFYGKNPMHRPHTLISCKEGLKWIKNAGGKKRKIINCSKNKVFEERLTLEEAIESIGEIKEWTREELQRKILKNK